MTAVFPARLGALLRRLPRSRQPVIFPFYQENVLGTSFELRVRCSCRQVAEEAECRALAEIDRLERIFSSFDPTSELRQWQNHRGQAITVSAELTEVLLASDHWREQSAGAFNPASETFSQLWKKAARENRAPSNAELFVCSQQAGQELWRLNRADQTAIYLADCPLTLNAIAKGYIVDRACDAALEGQEKVQDLTLNIGGDLRIRSDREEIVGVTDPDNDSENSPLLSHVRLQSGAVATSGDWRRGFRLGREFYSHIIDPRSGVPVSQVRSASVIAPSAADADALATIFSVLAPEESLVLADSLPGVGCLLFARNGQVFRSAEWRSREVSSGVNRPH